MGELDWFFSSLFYLYCELGIEIWRGTRGRSQSSVTDTDCILRLSWSYWLTGTISAGYYLWHAKCGKYSSVKIPFRSRFARLILRNLLLQQLYPLFDPVYGRKKLQQRELSPAKVDKLEQRFLKILFKVHLRWLSTSSILFQDTSGFLCVNWSFFSGHCSSLECRSL